MASRAVKDRQRVRCPGVKRADKEPGGSAPRGLSKRGHQHSTLDRRGELMRLLPAAKNQHAWANEHKPARQARQAASGAASSFFATAQL